MTSDDGFWGYDEATNEGFCRKCGKRWPQIVILQEGAAHAAEHQEEARNGQ